jgi:hypothetical protein
MPTRTWYKNFYTLKCNNFNTAIAATTYYPASASFIDVSNFERFVFLIEMGTLDTALTFTVMQASAIDGSPKALTNAAAIVIGTGDGDKWASIEVTTDQLDGANGYHFVSLYGTGASGSNDYACITFIGYRARHVPVSQSASYANTAATSPVEIVG